MVLISVDLENEGVEGVEAKERQQKWEEPEFKDIGHSIFLIKSIKSLF